MFEPSANESKAMANTTSTRIRLEKIKEQEAMLPIYLRTIRQYILSDSKEGLYESVLYTPKQYDLIFKDCHWFIFRRRRKNWNQAAQDIFKELEDAGYKITFKRQVGYDLGGEFSVRTLKVSWK
jgi:uncharacterized protein (UPF0335 family)